MKLVDILRVLPKVQQLARGLEKAEAGIGDGISLFDLKTLVDSAVNEVQGVVDLTQIKLTISSGYELSVSVNVPDVEIDKTKLSTEAIAEVERCKQAWKVFFIKQELLQLDYQAEQIKDWRVAYRKRKEEIFYKAIQRFDASYANLVRAKSTVIGMKESPDIIDEKMNTLIQDFANLFSSYKEDYEYIDERVNGLISDALLRIKVVEDMLNM